MIPPKIPIILFSLCRAPPRKFYVTGYAARGFDRFQLHSSLRSHTVGVSHVAHANTSEGVMASLACRVHGLGTQEDRKIEHESYVGCDRHPMSTFEVVLPALMMRGRAMDGDRVITKTMRGILVLSGSSGSFILKT